MGWSTTSPALTIIITRRGSFSSPHISSIECAPTTLVPLASLLMKSSTFETVRLNTATLYPWSFMLRTRFCPMTARPIKPMSQLAFSMKLLSESSSCVGRFNYFVPEQVFHRTGLNTVAGCWLLVVGCGDGCSLVAARGPEDFFRVGVVWTQTIHSIRVTQHK